MKRSVQISVDIDTDDTNETIARQAADLCTDRGWELRAVQIFDPMPVVGSGIDQATQEMLGILRKALDPQEKWRSEGQ